jgi:hypothetical protein
MNNIMSKDGKSHRLATHFIPTSRLKSYNVVNETGEDLGQAQNFIVDMISGRIAYVLVSFAGFMGLTDRWIALPFDALDWQPGHNQFVLNVPRAALMQAPSIKRADWPEKFLNDLEQEDHAAWAEDVYAYFSFQPFWLVEEESPACGQECGTLCSPE